MNEMIDALSGQIAEHETALRGAEKLSNAHAYHQGQIHKLSTARQHIKDAVTAAARYQEIAPHEADKNG